MGAHYLHFFVEKETKTPRKLLACVIKASAEELDVTLRDSPTRLVYCTEHSRGIQSMIRAIAPDACIIEAIGTVAHNTVVADIRGTPHMLDRADIDSCGFPCPPYSLLNPNRQADSEDAIAANNASGCTLHGHLVISKKRPSKFTLRENVAVFGLPNRSAQSAGPGTKRRAKWEKGVLTLNSVVRSDGG